MSNEVKCSPGYAGIECKQSSKEGGKCRCACQGENHGTETGVGVVHAAPKKATPKAETKEPTAEKKEEVESKSEMRRVASLSKKAGAAKPKTK